MQGSTVYEPKDGIHLKVINKLLDPGLRRDDGVRINQRFLKRAIERCFHFLVGNQWIAAGVAETIAGQSNVYSPATDLPS